MIVQDEMEPIVAEAGKSEARLRLKVGKDIDSYKRFCEGKPAKIFLTDERTGRRVATVFAGRKAAEWIALCVNQQA